MHLLLGNITRWFKTLLAQPRVTESPPAAAQVAAPPPAEPIAQEPLPLSPPRRNPREELEQGCYEMGRDGAINSGAPKVNTALAQSLEARAGAKAQSVHVPPSELREQRRIARLSVLGEDEERQTIDRDRAAVYHADEQKKLADLGPREATPVFPKKFYYAAIIGLSISIAPTFHDLFVGLDSFLKWVAGGICSVGVSMLIIHGLLPASLRETDNEKR